MQKTLCLKKFSRRKKKSKKSLRRSLVSLPCFPFAYNLPGALKENITTANKSSRSYRPRPTGPVPKVMLYKDGAPNAPYFPVIYELVYYQTLQWTDVVKNHNKYYVLEYHKATEGGKFFYRVYTHYGRTDDLVSKPGSGVRECRYYKSEDDVENGFSAILNEKTDKKGYRPVDLVFSNIGSDALKKLGESLHKDEDEDDSDRPTTSELEPAVCTRQRFLRLSRFRTSASVVKEFSNVLLASKTRL